MSKLPNGVSEIVGFLAGWAEGYNNHLKWNEEAKFKADLMNVPERWNLIDPDAFKRACLAEGMREEDSEMLTDYLRRRKQGRTLRPQSSYRNFRFPQVVDVFPERAKPTTTREW